MVLGLPSVSNMFSSAWILLLWTPLSVTVAAVILAVAILWSATPLKFCRLHLWVGWAMQRLELCHRLYVRGRRPHRIILMRHAESEGNVDRCLYTSTPDHALKVTERGKLQAAVAGKELKKLIGDESVLFIVSPYTRTRMTYRIVREELGPREFAMKEDPRLRELDFGNFQDLDIMQETMETRKAYGRFWFRFMNGESGADVYDRATAFWESVFRSMDHTTGRPYKNYVIITHGLMMRLVLMRYFQWTVEFFERVWNPNNCETWVMERDERGSFQLATEILDRRAWKSSVSSDGVDSPEPKKAGFIKRTALKRRSVGGVASGSSSGGGGGGGNDATGGVGAAERGKGNNASHVAKRREGLVSPKSMRNRKKIERESDIEIEREQQPRETEALSVVRDIVDLETTEPMAIAGGSNQLATHLKSKAVGDGDEENGVDGEGGGGDDDGDDDDCNDGEDDQDDDGNNDDEDDDENDDADEDDGGPPAKPAEDLSSNIAALAGKYETTTAAIIKATTARKNYARSESVRKNKASLENNGGRGGGESCEEEGKTFEKEEKDTLEAPIMLGVNPMLSSGSVLDLKTRDLEPADEDL